MKLLKKHLLIKRVISLIMVISFSLSLTATISAAGVDNIEASLVESGPVFEPIDDLNFKSQLIESLGMSEEEAKKYNFYTLDVPVDSKEITPLGIEIPSNTIYYWPEFTFYQSNAGAYWTVNANEFMWGIAYFNSPNDPNNYDLRLNVTLFSYGEQGNKGDVWVHTGDFVYSSNWIPVNWGYHDYRFVYSCSYLTDHRIYGTATVRMYLITSDDV